MHRAEQLISQLITNKLTMYYSPYICSADASPGLLLFLYSWHFDASSWHSRKYRSYARTNRKKRTLGTTLHDTPDN